MYNISKRDGVGVGGTYIPYCAGECVGGGGGGGMGSHT